jgi:uncharacterized protein
MTAGCDANWWIEHLDLSPHPEGGFYRETFRSEEVLAAGALPERYVGGERCFKTSIYYLLARGERSRFHRLASDEIWHFHAGDPVTVHLLDEEDGYRKRLVGTRVDRGDVLQLHIPRGVWFGATLDHSYDPRSAGYVLVGCTVAPGFDFADFEVAEREPLLAAHPEQAGIIRKLT